MFIEAALHVYGNKTFNCYERPILNALACNYGDVF